MAGSPDIRVAVLRQGARTSLGTQDWTSPGFGPVKAAKFFYSAVTSDGSSVNHARMGVGFTDGVNHRSVSVRSRHNRTTTSTERAISNSSVIVAIAQTTATVAGKAIFDSWVTDGIRLDYTTAFAAAYKVTCVLFGGADLSAAVKGITTNATEGGTTLENALGIDPNCMIFAGGHGAANAGPTVRNDCFISLGFAHNGADGPEQGCATFFDLDNQATTSAQSAVVSDKYAGWHASASSAGSAITGAALEVTDWVTGGIEATTREASEASLFVFLALDVGTADIAIVHRKFLAIMATQTIQDPEAEPQAVICLSTTSQEDLNTIAVNGDASGIGMGATANLAAGTEGACSISCVDNVSTTDTASHTDDTFFYQADDDGSHKVSGTVTTGSGSFNPRGITVDYISNLLFGPRWLALYIQNTPILKTIEATVTITESDIEIHSSSPPAATAGRIAQGGLQRGKVHRG